MLRTLLPRLAAASAIAILAVSCGGDATGPDPLAVAPASHGESDIDFNDDSPDFTLSLPASLEAGQRLSRRIDFSGPAASASVNYGEGAGFQGLSVQQASSCPGGASFCDTTDRIFSYWVNLSHTYTTPGTYTVTLSAAYNGDTRNKSASIEITEDPNIHIVDFEISEPAVAGERVDFSFGATGPGDAETLYTTRITFGTNLTMTGFIPPGGTRDRNYIWTEPGTYDLTIVVANDTHADTLVHSVVVEAAPVVCEPGTYEDGDACVPAPAGSFVAGAGATQPTPCAVGTYQDQIGQTSCKSAEAGSFVSAAGATEATLCAAGTYQDQTGQTSCKSAEAGSFVDVAGAAAATLCPVGTYQGLTGQTSCTDAAAGSFATGPGAVESELCAVGTFSASAGQAACDPAPAGHFVAAPGQTGATACEPGTYQDQTGQVSCLLVPAGSFAPTPGSTEATPCVPGTFQPAAGQVSCILAEPGSFAAGPGAVDDEECAPGTFSATPGQAACEPAPAGHYVATAGQTGATACEPGSFQGQVGQTSCMLAPTGSFAAGSASTDYTFCAPGTYQDQPGQAACIPAPAGHFTAYAGRPAATACEIGTYQPEEGSITCLIAPIGTYVDHTGAAQAMTCPIATSTLEAGSTSAADCIPLGEVALVTVDAAVADGKLVPAAPGQRGQNALSSWVSDLERSVRFLEGPQRQAGCVGIRNAYRKADGMPSPKDDVTGPAREAIAALLLRTLDESGC